MGKTLLIGNGINLLTHSVSWKNVIKRLAKFANKQDLIMEHIEEKPFTLVFEEIYLRSAKINEITELQLKEEVARIINEIPHSDYHEQLVQSNVRHILTTNYDYNLEDAAGNDYVDTSPSKETKYSLFRRRSLLQKNIWHIHGEYSVPNSIALGHDHISGSLHHIRDYLVTRSKRSQQKASPFLAGDLDFGLHSEDYSWLDIFLRDDIYIYGFSMDYTEIELWWLLSFKERLRMKGKPVGKTVFFYFPGEESNTKKEIGKRAILDSYGVHIIGLDGNNHIKAFYDFLESIKHGS